MYVVFSCLFVSFSSHIFCGLVGVHSLVYQTHSLASADIQVFGHTCLYAMLLLIGFALYKVFLFSINILAVALVAHFDFHPSLFHILGLCFVFFYLLVLDTFTLNILIL